MKMYGRRKIYDFMLVISGEGPFTKDVRTKLRKIDPPLLSAKFPHWTTPLTVDIFHERPQTTALFVSKQAGLTNR